MSTIMDMSTICTMIEINNNLITSNQLIEKSRNQLQEYLKSREPLTLASIALKQPIFNCQAWLGFNKEDIRKNKNHLPLKELINKVWSPLERNQPPL